MSAWVALPIIPPPIIPLPEKDFSPSRSRKPPAAPTPPPAEPPDVNAPAVPHWNPALRVLTWQGRVVKQYRQPAPNQEVILAAFQEDGWPPRIDDPLPLKPEIDPKQHLRDTIKNINRNQSRRLILFQGDGTGCGVCWSYLR